jgi:hypothetical protein
MSKGNANNMNTTDALKRIVAGALLSGGVAVAGLGLAAGTAQASPGRWCSGEPVPASKIVKWDMGVCHDYDM